MFLLGKNIKDFKTKLYWSLKSPYNPKEFWENWGKTFRKEPQQQKIYPQHFWILEKLEAIKPQSLLEIGCGFGRNIQFLAANYHHPIKVTGCDISFSMLENARKYLRGIKFNNQKPILIQADILNLPFKNSSFDLVLIHGVLMHIQPKNIEQAVSGAVRVSKKFLIIVEQNFIGGKPNKQEFLKINQYTFAYNHEKLFTKFGCRILEYKKTKVLDWLLMKKVNNVQSV